MNHAVAARRRVVTSFEPLGELEATGCHDAAVHEDVDGVRGDVVEEALVVGDDQEAAIGAVSLLTPPARCATRRCRDREWSRP